MSNIEILTKGYADSVFASGPVVKEITSSDGSVSVFVDGPTVDLKVKSGGSANFTTDSAGHAVVIGQYNTKTLFGTPMDIGYGDGGLPAVIGDDAIYIGVDHCYTGYTNFSYQGQRMTIKVGSTELEMGENDLENLKKCLNGDEKISGIVWYSRYSSEYMDKDIIEGFFKDVMLPSVTDGSRYFGSSVYDRNGNKGSVSYYNGSVSSYFDSSFSFGPVITFMSGYETMDKSKIATNFNIFNYLGQDLELIPASNFIHNTY